MKKYFILILPIFTLLGLTNCGSSYYSKSDYQIGPLDHITIAILPYQVITTGRIPYEWTEEDLKAVENGESRAFQISLHNQMLRQLDARRNYTTTIQHYSETNSRLKKANIELQNAWDIPASELCEILGVDAVAKSEVHKSVYLTDLESFGIELAASIIWAITDIGIWFGGDNRTGDVRISCSIINGQEGLALWASSRKMATYWDRNAYEAIERVNYKISKRLPF